jgi:MraZ protein
LLQIGAEWIKFLRNPTEALCVLFTGEYVHQIDAKQRLAIPADIRARMSAELHGEAMYLVPGANGSLWLWPELTFERMASAIEQSLLPGEEMMEFEELLFSQSRRLEIDKAGRVRIPEQMLAEYSLGETVIILGVRDHLELRDPAQWKSQREQKLAKQADIMLRARQALNKQISAGTNSAGKQDRP